MRCTLFRKGMECKIRCRKEYFEIEILPATIIQNNEMKVIKI